MKICRYGDNGLALVRDGNLYDVSSLIETLGTYGYPFPAGDLLIANLERLKPLILQQADSSEPIAASEVKLLSPVANTGKIIAAPVNYAAHLEEALEDPEVGQNQPIPSVRVTGPFFKAPSSLVGAGEGICIRHEERRTDHEIELVAVIGREGTNITESNALSYVAGYCVGLDITLRGPDDRGHRKSVDSYTVVGPWLVTSDEVPDPADVALRLDVNGVVRQADRTSNQVMSLVELIARASSYYTVYPGDLIFTGTPAGIGPICPGDEINASIESIGEMQVLVS